MNGDTQAGAPAAEPGDKHVTTIQNAAPTGPAQPEEVSVNLGLVPFDALQRWLAEVNQILTRPADDRFGQVETEVRRQQLYIRPLPSYKFEVPAEVASEASALTKRSRS